MIKNLKMYEKIKGCKNKIVSFVLAGTMAFSSMVTEVNGKTYHDEEQVPFSIEEIEDLERITKEKVTANDQIVKYKNFLSALNILADKGIIFRRSERIGIYNHLNRTSVPCMVKQISDKYITEEELNELNNEFIDLIKHEIELDKLYKKESLLNNIDFDFIPSFVLFLNSYRLTDDTFQKQFDSLNGNMSETVIGDFCEELERKYYEFWTILDALIEYNMIDYRDPNILSSCIKDEELSQLIYEIEDEAKYYKYEILENPDSFIHIELNMYDKIKPIYWKIFRKYGFSIFDVMVDRIFDNILGNKTNIQHDQFYSFMQMHLLIANKIAYIKKENAKVLSKTNK